MAKDDVTTDDAVESEAVAEETTEAVEEALPEAWDDAILAAEAGEEVKLDFASVQPTVPVAVVAEAAPAARHEGWDGWTVQAGALPVNAELGKVNFITPEQMPDPEKFALNGGHADVDFTLVARKPE